MTPLFTMRQAVEDPALLGTMLDGPSWATWRALLIASRGEELTSDELALFRARTGRDDAPVQPVEEAAFIAGRRSGKTVAAAVYAAYLCALVDWSDCLARGERGVLLFLAQNTRTARVAFRYATALFDEVPMLSRLVTNRTQEAIELSTGIDLEIRPASFRGLRGMTAIGIVADELSVWFSDDSANPDTEILAAARPALATTGGPLLMVSSPYGRKGELWETYRRHYGPAGDAHILVAKGASREFNETLPQRVVDRAMERDPGRATAEYLGDFRTDVESFIAREAVEACVSRGVYERGKTGRHVGFADPAGGGGQDSFTMAVAHREGKRVVLDLVREVRPPFSPEQVAEDFARTFKTYGINKISGDRYAGEWPAEQFRKHGVIYSPNASPKSTIYGELLPLINSGAADLLDNERMLKQLLALERKVARGGRDSIDHPRGQSDDVINAAAGAITSCRGSTYDLMTLVRGPDDPALPNFATRQLYASMRGPFGW